MNFNDIFKLWYNTISEDFFFGVWIFYFFAYFTYTLIKRFLPHQRSEKHKF